MINPSTTGDDTPETMFATSATSEHAPGSVAHPKRLRAMVDDHWVSLGRILRSLGVADHEIEDALQQVYIVAASKLASITPGKERAFLIQVGVNIAARARRKRASARETASDDTDASAADGPSAEETIDRHRALALLDRVIDAMDDDTREVFVLHEVEEMTMAEIATTLDLAPGTVASRLRRAREQFSLNAARLRREKVTR